MSGKISKGGRPPEHPGKAASSMQVKAGDRPNTRHQASPRTSPLPARPIRVLVVDDSAFMRFSLSRRMGETEGIILAATARDGEEALAMIPELKPDVITLDVDMPRKDGLSTLHEIMTHFPCPVIMLSNLTRQGTQETIQALALGAVDFVAKPDIWANVDSIMEELILKIHRAAGARIAPLSTRWRVETTAPPSVEKTTHPFRRQDHMGNRVIVIGASTGGPRALITVMSQLPADLPAAVLIVQHMPAGFTRSLAEQLDHVSPLSVKEAAAGDRLGLGCALVAPGGFHMTVSDSDLIELNQNPPVHGVRPAVDVTMASVSYRYGAAVIGVVLTGMGSDGANGSSLIHCAGGRVIAEDPSTCVVWGMPRSVAEAGVADRVTPIHDVAQVIVQLARP